MHLYLAKSFSTWRYVMSTYYLSFSKDSNISHRFHLRWQIWWFQRNSRIQSIQSVPGPIGGWKRKKSASLVFWERVGKGCFFLNEQVVRYYMLISCFLNICFRNSEKLSVRHTNFSQPKHQSFQIIQNCSFTGVFPPKLWASDDFGASDAIPSTWKVDGVWKNAVQLLAWRGCFVGEKNAKRARIYYSTPKFGEWWRCERSSVNAAIFWRYMSRFFERIVHIDYTAEYGWAINRVTI